MGATAALAAIAVGTAVHTDQQSKSARFAQKSEQGRAQAERARAEKKQMTKKEQEDQRRRQQQARAKQKGIAAGGEAGRQGTILGGAGAGNAGNQIQSGAGKTLLGS